MLTPAACACCGDVEIDRAAVEEDGARVAAVGAGQNLDQGRFARAVLARPGRGPRPAPRARTRPERDHTGEGFADTLHDEEESAAP